MSTVYTPVPVGEAASYTEPIGIATTYTPIPAGEAVSFNDEFPTLAVVYKGVYKHHVSLTANVFMSRSGVALRGRNSEYLVSQGNP